MSVHKAENQYNAEKLAPLRGSVLSEMHQGRMKTAPALPVLDILVRACFVVNVASAVVLWILFSGVRMFHPAEEPFLWALMWFFIFGCIYGVFAALTLLYGRSMEHTAVVKALTPNRRYEWHRLYDIHNVSDDALKRRQPASVQKPHNPTGAGYTCYRHATLLIVCSFLCCFAGVYAFVGVMRDAVAV